MATSNASRQWQKYDTKAQTRRNQHGEQRSGEFSGTDIWSGPGPAKIQTQGGRLPAQVAQTMTAQPSASLTE